MPTYKVVACPSDFDNLDIERSVLEPAGAEVTKSCAQSTEALLSEVGDADALLVQYTQIGSHLLTQARKCKIVVRYGTGYDPEKTFVKLLLLDTRGKVLGEAAFPYALFSYKEKWVDVVLPEPLGLGVLAEDGELLRVAFDPGATRYKGIYFHYTRNPKISHSLVGTAAREFQETPDREWLIRAYFVAEPVP